MPDSASGLHGTIAGGSDPVVSIVVVNYRGAQDTVACLRSLTALEWPADRLEIVVVENASGDDSAQVIRSAFPEVVLVESERNLGFAGGCNLGVSRSRGTVVGFINNDARPDPRWVSAAIDVLRSDDTVGAVASKVLDWDGAKVDFVDASLTWFGMGYKREVEQDDSSSFGTARDVLFATGAAMFVRADLFRQVGGFDERFFMFYEDVDLGWRLNVLGHRVRYVPGSVAYHRHHATMKKFGQFRESYLLERNALMSMYKNYEQETLLRTLPGAMALAVRRSVARTGLDARLLDLEVRPGDEGEDVTVPKMALTGPLAIDYLVENLPALTEDRTTLQRQRVRSDHELLPLFRQAMEPAYPFPSYVQAHRDIVAAFDVEDAFSHRRTVAVVTGEPLGTRMAGPAIRAYEMCRVLAPGHDVQLVTLGQCDLDGDGFEVRSANRRDLREIVAWADVVVFQGLLLSIHPWIADEDVILVADIYDPFHLEVLEQERARPLHEREEVSRETVRALNLQISRADFLLCASDKQRDFWLGQLAGNGRVNPLTYDVDESLRALIDVAPFGLPNTPPTQTAHPLRGTLPGIGVDDKIVLWGGGVYNWFDPLTLIEAVNLARVEVPDIRLVFLGMKHPNPGVPEMAMADRTRARAAELGLTDRFVFFNEQWVPYDERQNYLLEADLGVSCHFDHVETEFSFRTRVLDYLWAGLPIVCTSGDSLGDLVAAEGIGIAVPPEDVRRLASALTDLLTDDDRRAASAARAREVATRFTWERSLAPLTRFVQNPRRGADRVVDAGRLTGTAPTRPGSSRPPRPRVADDIRLARQYLAEGGLREVGSRAVGRVRRLSGRQPT